MIQASILNFRYSYDDLYIMSYFIVYSDWSEDFVMSKKPTYEELEQRVRD